MSKRIGEALIERGLLTSAELDEALQHQLILGGNLGTSLIELGFVDEVSLGRTLSAVLGLPYAPREAFLDIPRRILEQIPTELAQVRRVVPIGVESRSLHVAVVDRRSLPTLSNMTGQRIVPYVSPEIRIMEALDRYYGVSRQPRYVRLSAFPNGRSKRRVAVNAPVNGDSASTLSTGLRRLSKMLSRVNCRGELGEVVLEYVGAQAERCMLFVVSGSRARVANWRGVPLDPDRVGEIELEVTPRSIFGLVLEESLFHGTIEPPDAYASFFDAMKIGPPRDCLILPVYGERNLESVLYADGGTDGSVSGSTDEYQAMADQIGLAQKMIAFRTRLASA